MHACLRQPMRLCRWVGVFPVEGLNKKTCSELRFNLNSTYTIYHCLTLLAQFFLTCASAYHFFNHNLSLNHLISVVFYTTNMTTAFFIVKLARNWPTLVQKASSIERSVHHIIQSGSKSPENYTRIAYIVLILSLLEHILSVSFKMKLLINCREEDTIERELIEHFFSLTASFVFDLTSFTYWKAILFEVANLQSTFLWNFTDVMTMCISLYLTSYFKVLNKLIEHQQNLNIIRWEEIRIYYTDLVQLIKIVDSKMCYLILLSFFTNVFFICVQVFSLLNSNYPVIMDCHVQVNVSFKSVEYYIYYCYSSLFLFVRATVTSLLAANLNTVAQKPFYILQYVPTSEYTMEVQRFIRQIKYTSTALSGVFFDVTRGMILTVIGTIVKYELVLLQFSVRTYEAIH